LEFVQGRMMDSHTLNGLGGGYDLRLVKRSAKKSCASVEGLVPVPQTDTGG
jgi:hypothetical protein